MTSIVMGQLLSQMTIKYIISKAETTCKVLSDNRLQISCSCQALSLAFIAVLRSPLSGHSLLTENKQPRTRGTICFRSIDPTGINSSHLQRYTWYVKWHREIYVLTAVPICILYPTRVFFPEGLFKEGCARSK